MELHLKINYLPHPKGVRPDQVQFGWQLLSEQAYVDQFAYQVRVTYEGKEVWSSGQVRSKLSQRINYSGIPLQPATRYDVEATVWCLDGSSVMGRSVFDTAPEQFTAQWIGAIRREEANLPKGKGWHAPSLAEHQQLYDRIPEMAKRSIMLRMEVNLKKEVKSAMVYISGLGHYELQLNGEKVGQSEFAPLWTDYDQSVYFNTYEVTNLLNPGRHAIGVTLGNGMFNVIGNRYRKFWRSFGPPTLLFELRIAYADGSSEVIHSDKSWKYAMSPITFNDLFGGEDYDARLEQPGWAEVGFDDSGWQPVVIQDSPQGTLKPQWAPAIEVQEWYEAQGWQQVDSVTCVFNMGQNLAGFPRVALRGAAGQQIRLVVGERLDENGYVSQHSTGRPHYYAYTLNGAEMEEWHPRFSYYGYQYLQVEGAQYLQAGIDSLPELLDLQSGFVYSNATPIGTFECSNELFTRTHTLINNAIKSNMQAVFTDCPHREKLGWIEEIHLNGPGLLYNYDLTQLLRKEMMDMADAQRPNGLVPNIVPEYVDFSQESWGADFTDSPEWGAAVVVVPWQYYTFYGDASLMVKYYEVMLRYVNYLSSRATNGIVSHGLGDWYDYGTHAAGYSKNSPIALSATAHYYRCIDGLAKAAKLMGKQTDGATYDRLAREVKTAYNRAFFHPDTKQYGTGSQYSNAVSLYMGLVREHDRQAVLDRLVEDIAAHGNRLTTGDIGNRYLFQTLAENNLNDLLFEMINHEEVPGYGYQSQYGLTTLAEQWDPEKGNSWNHFMMGQIEEWFFKSLAGIKADPAHPGFQQFIIAPKLSGDLTYVKASTQSLYGTIAVHWRMEDNNWIITLNIPANSRATMVLPKEVDSNQRELMLKSGKHTLTYPMNS